MIYAQFRIKNQRINQFTLSGHAESGPKGHDLVCAAASALTIGTTNNLKRIAAVEPNIEADEEEGGFLKVTLPEKLNVKQKEYAHLLLQSLYFSLSDMEETYGEYITVSEQEID